jgi:hypothetical protein
MKIGNRYFEVPVTLGPDTPCWRKEEPMITSTGAGVALVLVAVVALLAISMAEGSRHKDH